MTDRQVGDGLLGADALDSKGLVTDKGEYLAMGSLEGLRINHPDRHGAGHDADDQHTGA